MSIQRGATIPAIYLSALGLAAVERTGRLSGHIIERREA